MKRVLAVVAVLLSQSAYASAQQTCSGPANAARSLTSVPAVRLAGRVTDQANVLSAKQRLRLSRELEQFERATKHQMVVVTVRSLRGRNVADFARDLSNSWAIGRKCYNDGITLLVAPNERKVRIAVGYGLEKTLTHDLSQRIINQEIVPAFRRGDLPGGIEAGTHALIAAAR